MFQIWPSRCVALIKKELMYAGPFGLAAILSGTVFIDRINTKSALDTMKSTVKRVKDERVSNIKRHISGKTTNCTRNTCLHLDKF